MAITTSLKICSWNVNGIRAVFSKGLEEFIHSTRFDLYFFQEIKAQEHQIPETLEKLKNYNAHWFPAERKGYSGVGLLIKKSHNILKISKGINISKFDTEGRSIMVELEDYIIFGCYYPNGQRDHGRVPYKLEFSKEIEKLALKLNKKTKKPIIITGDFNTAHNEIDLKNPKTNQKSTGFLPIEREYMDQFCHKGFVDLFRNKYPMQEEAYTWWTYRNGCRERNIGWRLDYFFSTSDLLSQIKDVKHLTEILGSDHCPIVLEIKKK